MKSPEQLLKAAKTVMLVDWPDQSVPRNLVKAGLTVYGYSPDGYSKADVVLGKPDKADGISIFPPKDDETGYLVFEKAEGLGQIDIVCIYRPEAEHEMIFNKQVLLFGAKTIWLQPPITSSAISGLAEKNGTTIIEGINIAEAAAKI